MPEKYSRVSKRSQAIFIVGIVVVVVAGGILFWAYKTGRLKPRAAVGDITNQAQVSYQDSSGQIFTGLSNIVTTIRQLLDFVLKVTLQGRSNESATVHVTVFQTGTPTVVTEGDVQTNDQGIVTSWSGASSIPPGTYDVVAKPEKYLATKLTGIVFPLTFGVDFGEAPGGDVNNNNVVDEFDWSLVNSNWDTSNTAGDANGDGTVNDFDWSLVNSNWDKKGL